jgi:hypothetical protein
MANKVPKPSRERGLLSGVALALALALVASLLYVQPVIGGSQPRSCRYTHSSPRENNSTLIGDAPIRAALTSAAGAVGKT